jgi:hypothetical protein
LREEHRVRAFENTVLRRIVGPKRYEVTEGWRELHNFYLLASTMRTIKPRRMRSEWHVV